MRILLGVLMVIFVGTAAQAMDFDPNGKLWCALDLENSSNRYQDIQKFYILESGADGSRDLKVGIQPVAEDACVTSTDALACQYKEFEIHIDLSTVIEYSMNGADGYRVLGMAKIDWGFEAGLTCYQDIY